jgi:ParB-like chromosome segregation protein Spo0J
MGQLIDAGFTGDPARHIKAGDVTMDPDTRVYRWIGGEPKAEPEAAPPLPGASPAPVASSPPGGTFPAGEKLELHPLCEIFPRISGGGLDELIADMQAHGQREPVVMHEGKILDGRNRYVALDAAGMPIRYVDFEGDDPVAFVISMNLHRRHIDASQRAMIAAKLANLRDGQTKAAASIDAPLSQPEAAGLLNVSRSAIQRAEVVRREGVPELVEAVESGAVTVAAAVEIAKETPAEQQRIIALPEPERREVVRTRRECAVQEIKAKLPADVTPFKVPAIETPVAPKEDDEAVSIRVSLTNAKQTALTLFRRMSGDVFRDLVA